MTDRQLMGRNRDGDERAREALIERYLPLARSLALRYRRTAEPFDDLIQVASLGLIKAVDRWDPDRGFAFSTYAVPTILGELRRYFRDYTWMVRPPRDVMDLTLAIERVREPFNAAIGHEPTERELAEKLDRTPEAVGEAMQAVRCRTATSLDSPSLEDAPEPATIGALIPGGDDEYARAEDRATLDSLTSILDHRAREILRLRYEDDLLQSQIAERVGCSQMHVSRILRSSLERLSEYAAAA